MKLNSDLKKSLAAYTADLKGDISITLQKGSHKKRDDLVTFLSDVCSVSSRLNLQENDNLPGAKSPLSFTLSHNGIDSGIAFSGIPAGHEFNTFVLAILQLGGSDLKLDENIKSVISSIDDKLNFEVFISLSKSACNCSLI